MKLLQKACSWFGGPQPPWISRVSVMNHNPTNLRRCISLSHSNHTSTSTSSLPEEDEEVLEATTPSRKGKKGLAKSGEESDLKPRKSKVAKEEAPSKAIQASINYITKHSGVKEELSSLISNQFLRPGKVKPTSVYLVNKVVAKTMAEMIQSEEPDLNSPVLELHPGLGLLTSHLLNTVGFKYVTCLEDNAKLAESLRSRFNISVVDAAIDDLPRHHHLDKHDGGERINNIITQITTESPDTNPFKRRLHVIGVLPHINAINFMIRSYVTQRVLFEDDTSWSGFTFFVGLGGKPDLVCNGTRKDGLVVYRPTSIFFQTLFNSKEIGVLPREAFVPWESEDKAPLTGLKSRKIKVTNPKIIRVFRIEANSDTEDKIGKENLFSYWYFVRQCLYARTNRIIPELEKWIPGCGPRLIRQGYNIYSQFGLLEPAEILQLYLQFVSWPEFPNSSFLSAVDKFQTRLEISEEDNNL